MATTIEQQMALDEALVPSTKRLRIGRSNFRLPSNIQSKESTLQVVYDVLRRSPFFKAFLVTADNTQQYGTILPIELTNKDIRNTKAYKEYYACATREAAPKPKASTTRKRGGSDSSTTPPTAVASLRPITTIAAAPRLTAAAKGKQPARATSPIDPLEVERIEAEQLKIVLRRSRQETHISQHGSSSTDEGTESGEGDDEETKSDGEIEEEETRKEEEESFDPILRTPEDSEDDGNRKEDQGLRVSEEQRLIEEEEADELYRNRPSERQFKYRQTGSKIHFKEKMMNFSALLTKI
nr:hypothetical protein [Tanacetum cinerariifolium]